MGPVTHQGKIVGHIAQFEKLNSLSFIFFQNFGGEGTISENSLIKLGAKRVRALACNHLLAKWKLR